MQRVPHNNPHVLSRRISPAQHSSAFTITELLAVVVITWMLLWLILPRLPVGPPPEYHVERALDQIQMALNSCVAATGTAPTSVDELPQLSGTYLDIGDDPERLLSKMVRTGRDYWGNRLEIQADPDSGRRYTLRSYGPDGLLDNTEDSDDIVISYTALIADRQ